MQELIDLPISLETLPTFAASIRVPQRFFRELLLVPRICCGPVASPGTLLVLVWCGLFFTPGPNMPLRVEPNRSWWEFSCCTCWRDAMNSATGGRVPLPPGCGAMLKPFIKRRSFWRFFLPPAPMDISLRQPSTGQTENRRTKQSTKNLKKFRHLRSYVQ